VTALADITKALSTMPPVERGTRRFVVVGKAAMYAIRAEAKDPKVKPTHIGNSTERYAIIETDQFPGWTVVDRSGPFDA